VGEQQPTAADAEAARGHHELELAHREHGRAAQRA
jgi:hypothetical protein